MELTIVTDPDKDTAANSLKIIQAFTIVKENLDEAVNTLGLIKTWSNMVEAEKEKLMKPLNNAATTERNRWKELCANLEKAEATLKYKIDQYQITAAAEAKKQADAVQHQIDTGRIKKPEVIAKRMEAIETVGPVIASSSGTVIQTKKVRDIEITNPLLIPREYLDINMAKLRKDALSDIVIPGVKVVIKNQLAVSV